MRHASIFIVVLAAVAAGARGQTVTVTTQSDAVDINASTATIADLPGPDGKVSLSEALIATDNTPGHQTIAFAVPEEEWTFQFLFPGRAVFTSITGFYWRAFDSVTIDATTQTAFTGDTNPDGGEIVLYQWDLVVAAPGSVVRGFDSTELSVGGAGTVVEHNTGGHIAAGSGCIVRHNTGGTLNISGNGSVVTGNTFQRLRLLGGLGTATGNVIGGPDPADRNHFTGYGTHNSEGLPAGTAVQIVNTADTLFENNWVGTTVDGLASGNSACTVGIGFGGDNTDVTIRGNRIAGVLGIGQNPHHAGQLFGYAVSFSGTGAGIVLENNTIGLDANDDPVLGSVWGIDVGTPVTNPADYDDIRIEGNTIAGHIFNGVTIGPDVSPVRLAGNSIFDNGWLGIDLIPSGYGYGADPNDALDVDTGGNGLQNFPELTSAERVGASTRITGMLLSAPLGDYTIEFFASPACDDSGFGEGQVFLGSTDVTTDVGGAASFDVLLPVAVAPGWAITATATLEPIGETSEFSACRTVQPGAPVPGDADGNGVVDVDDVVYVILRWGPCDAPPAACAADVNSTGVVDVDDVVMVILNWT